MQRPPTTLGVKGLRSSHEFREKGGIDRCQVVIQQAAAVWPPHLCFPACCKIATFTQTRSSGGGRFKSLTPKTEIFREIAK
jgi:hypothetical protein